MQAIHCGEIGCKAVFDLDPVPHVPNALEHALEEAKWKTVTLTEGTKHFCPDHAKDAPKDYTTPTPDPVAEARASARPSSPATPVMMSPDAAAQIRPLAPALPAQEPPPPVEHIPPPAPVKQQKKGEDEGENKDDKKKGDGKEEKKDDKKKDEKKDPSVAINEPLAPPNPNAAKKK